MPAISQIGFGTNDYATLAAWLTAEENNDYSGVGPIAEIDSSADAVLSATFQPRFGTASALTIRAATGSEFNGDFGGTHAKITGGQTIDIRMSNVNFENVEIVGNFESTGDTYDGLTLTGCGVRGYMYLDKTLTTAVDLTNTIIYSTDTVSNRPVYINGSDTDLTNVTVIATNATATLGSIYIRNSGSTVSINDVAVYSVGDTYEIHSGDTPTVTGDYNAGSDALLIGANSIATLGTDDFEDFASLDFRIAQSSELLGAGTGGGNIGAFAVATPAIVSHEAILYLGQGYYAIEAANIPISTNYGADIGGEDAVFVSRNSDLFVFQLTDEINALTANDPADDPATLGYEVRIWYGD